MSVYVSVETRIDGDEETLIDALTWILRRKFLKKAKKGYVDVLIKDYEGNYIAFLHGSSWRYTETITGTLEFSYKFRKELGIEEKVDFEVRLDAIPTPKGRFENDGVVVELKAPINKRYWIKGLGREEFKIVKIEEI